MKLYFDWRLEVYMLLRTWGLGLCGRGSGGGASGLVLGGSVVL
jgi:hypothetical protein